MEQWKTHPATGLQVSTEGRVITRNKGMQLGDLSGGYYRVNRNYRIWLVHRLVAETFIPNPEGKPQVNHKNGNKHDNRVENLEWVTNGENQQHAYDTGLKQGLKGELHGQNKLTGASVREIRQNTHGLSQRALAAKYGVSRRAIRCVLDGTSWRHI